MKKVWETPVNGQKCPDGKRRDDKNEKVNEHDQTGPRRLVKQRMVNPRHQVKIVRDPRQPLIENEKCGGGGQNPTLPGATLTTFRSTQKQE